MATGPNFPAGGMSRFVVHPRRTPAERAPKERAGDFREIYGDFIAAKAAEQASRCAGCGVPFCQSGCPLQNNIPDWLRMTAEGRLREAYDLAQATSSMPEICGRICPQDRLCEGVCTTEQSGHGAVTIGAVERYIVDTAWNEGWVEPLRPGRDQGRTIGIVGAGPAGLTAAERLRELGYGVVVYDRHDRPGGLLIYGIPGFKLDKAVVERRTRRLAQGGVQFRLNFEVGRDATLPELRQQHEAVLIACGAYGARELGAPAPAGSGVAPALEYLTASNRLELGDPPPPAFSDGSLDARDKRVVVIGGGDTAMDCVRTAVRQGAASVVCLYRRDRANMPGSRREVLNAEQEGVAFEWMAGPRAVLSGPEGVGAVRAARMRFSVADASGRRSVEPTDESFDLPADMVIKALGFDVEPLPVQWGAPELGLTRHGSVWTDRHTGMTSIDGVFAAGDAARGASLVVWAIRDGREAAESIDRFVRSRQAARPALVAAE